MPPLDSNSNLTQQLDQIHQDLMAIADHYEKDNQSLLKILRELEATHRTICENYFYPNLPNRRRNLYNLLRDIEEQGGWPFIARPKLKLFIENYLNHAEDADTEHVEKTEAES